VDVLELLEYFQRCSAENVEKKPRATSSFKMPKTRTFDDVEISNPDGRIRRQSESSRLEALDWIRMHLALKVQSRIANYFPNAI
jgi:hypothetical protein